MRCEIIDGAINVFDGDKLVLVASPAIAVHVALDVLRCVKADSPDELAVVGQAMSMQDRDGSLAASLADDFVGGVGPARRAYILESTHWCRGQFRNKIVGSLVLASQPHQQSPRSPDSLLDFAVQLKVPCIRR